MATYMDINYKEALTEEGQSLRNDTIVAKLCDKVRTIMKDIYGKQYADNKGIPMCVWRKIHYTFPTNEYFSESSEDETSDSDSPNNDPDKMMDPRFFQVFKKYH